MRKFIFISAEGNTSAPNADYEVQNLQVIGIVDNVEDEDAALIKLLKENVWIIDAEYNVAEFIVYEIM